MDRDAAGAHTPKSLLFTAQSPAEASKLTERQLKSVIGHL